MRTFFTLLLLSIATAGLWAQSPFSFGINAQLGLSGETKGIERQSDFRGTFDYSEERHPLVPVIGAGGWVAYAVNEKVRFQTGLQYVNSGNVDLYHSYAESLSTGQRTSEYTTKYHFRAHQLQLPLEIQLSIGKGKLQPLISLGAQITRDWVGNIYRENPYFIDDEMRTFIWTSLPKDRNEVDAHILGVQPVLGFGLHFNDQLSVRLRRTWIGQKQQLNWYENLNPYPIDAPNPIFGWYGASYSQQTESTHRQVTSLEFSYRIF